MAQLISPVKYEKLQKDLAEIFAAYASRGIVYVPPLTTLPSDEYIDYGHLRDQGNAEVARAIIAAGRTSILSAVDPKQPSPDLPTN